MQGVQSTGKSSSALLGIGETFEGVAERTPHDQATVLVYSDKAGTLTVKRSLDGENWDFVEEVSVEAATAVARRFAKGHCWWQTAFENTSGEAQTEFRLGTFFGDNFLSDLSDVEQYIGEGEEAAAAELPRGYIDGLTISNNGTDADHDIDIAVGEARDVGDEYDLALTSGLTKRIDASWAAGTGNGGLFSGSVGNATWYYVHLIRKDSDGSIDGGFDTSATAANIPTGYSAYRRIGSVRTDGSGNILAFKQRGDWFGFNTSQTDLNTTTPQTSWTALTLTVPPIEGVVAIGYAYCRPGSAVIRSLFMAAGGHSASPSAGAGEVCAESGVTSQGGTASFMLPVSSSGQVLYYGSHDTSVDALIRTKSWIDPRGKV